MLGVFLVVADAQLAEQLRTLVAAEGECYLAGEAADAAAAAVQIRQARPDAVVLDLALPDWGRLAEDIHRHGADTLVFVTGRASTGQLREAMRLGIKGFVPPGADAALFHALVRELPEHRESEERVPGRVVCTFSTKGGVGKTTLAVNLAVAMGDLSGQWVALADMDLEHGNAATLLGRGRPPVSIVELCRTGAITEAVLGATVGRMSGCRVDFLAAPPSPELAARVEGEGRPEPRNYVAEILEALQRRYAWVVVDTGCHWRESNLTILERADIVLLVTTPDILALRNTAATLEKLLEGFGFSQEKVRLVLNRHAASLAVSIDNISRGLGYPVSFVLPSDAVTAVGAANQHSPFMGHRGRTPLSAGVQTMAESLLGPRVLRPGTESVARRRWALPFR